MAISLRESKAVSDMADLIYDFLPGSGNSKWEGHVTFRSVANDVGVGDFVRQGNKTQLIICLLTSTLEHRRSQFEPLILRIVRDGIAYRKKQSKPITSREIVQLNGLLLEVNFKFPELWNTEFQKSLEINTAQRAQQHVDSAIANEKKMSLQASARLNTLQSLESEFNELAGSLDRQSAGLQLEKILNQLFLVNNLNPRMPFRVVGEQIDGSFELDNDTYLVEAKWTSRKVSESQLMVFREKIMGKSAHTRGLFISISGYSAESLDAITRGKQPVFFAIDGYDIMMLLRDQVEMKELLRRRRRLLAEEGKVWVPFNSLWTG